MTRGDPYDPGLRLVGLMDLRDALTDDAHVALVMGAERRLLDRWSMSDEFEGIRALWYLRRDVLRTMRWPEELRERFWRDWDPSGCGTSQADTLRRDRLRRY